MNTHLMLPVLLAFCLGAVFSNAQTNQEQLSYELENYEESSNFLARGFKDSSEKYFWDQQEKANELLKADSSSTDGYALKKLSNLFMRTKCISYALWRNAIEIAKIIITKQLDPEQGDTPPEVKLETGEFDLFGGRVALRAAVDTFFYTKSQWEQIHKLLVRYVGNDARLELLELAQELYNQRRQSSITACDMLDAIDEYFDDRDIGPEKANEKLNQIDRLLEEATGCIGEKCERVDFDKFGTRLMVSKSKEVEALVKKYVGDDLLQALEKSEQAIEGNLNELPSGEVDVDEIDERQENFLKKRE